MKGVFLVFIYLMLSGFYSVVKGETIPDSISYYTNRMSEVHQNAKLFPEESYQFFKNGYRLFKQAEDSQNVISCLIEMAEIQRLGGKYGLSFDHLWEAQYLSSKSKNIPQKAKIHRKLAVLYGIFNMDEEVTTHMEESLRCSKEILFENENNIQQINAVYISLALKNRRMGNLEKAEAYLDSCSLNDKLIKNNYYAISTIDAERGYINLLRGKLDLAESYLFKAKQFAEKNNQEYVIQISLFLGDLKRELNQLDSAIFYYKNSLELIGKFNHNKILSIELYKKLSTIYNEKNKNGLAYQYLMNCLALTDSLNRIKNKTNSELFHIKNSYLESITEKNELLEKQSEEIKENRLVQQRLKIILGLLVVLVVVAFIILRMRLKLKRILLDKKEAEMQSELIEQRSAAEIELKSKELTSYALQLIDKDRAIDELLETIKQDSPGSYKPLLNKYKKGSEDLWTEFNMRFTEVNTAFYDRLKKKHPDLSPTEQKHCALIKLNFAAKEMARILNIETHSVHISRSRIRKKIGLERSESLEHYIRDL